MRTSAPKSASVQREVWASGWGRGVRLRPVVLEGRAVTFFFVRGKFVPGSAYPRVEAGTDLLLHRGIITCDSFRVQGRFVSEECAAYGLALARRFLRAGVFSWASSSATRFRRASTSGSGAGRAGGGA